MAKGRWKGRASGSALAISSSVLAKAALSVFAKAVPMDACSAMLKEGEKAMSWGTT